MARTSASASLQLKVGELARRTGLTVRALHHYDEIGLLKPSGRSESGYRLYNADDVARLHGIQALRQLGLPLTDIGAVLQGEHAASPREIVHRQIDALDAQIRQQRDLRAKLGLIHEMLAKGDAPSPTQWLDALSLMTTMGKYFDTHEIKAILEGWHSVEDEWQPLMRAMREAMDAGHAHDALEIQPLVRQWMGVMHRAMGGDFAVLERWDAMYTREPDAHGRNGAPPTDMIEFVRRAVDVRMQVMGKYLTKQEMERCRPIPEACWREIDREGRALMAAGALPGDPAARALARRWIAALTELAGGDPVLRDKLLRAHEAEPLLRAGAATAPPLRAFLRQALDPHAT